MVLGRRELSAILLAIVAIAFYLLLLSTTPSGAQTGGNTTTQIITQQTITPNPVTQGNQGGVTAIANPPRKPQKERSIINVPKKPLPPSGGLPVYAVVTSFVLTGVGLLALGMGIWRGARR